MAMENRGWGRPELRGDGTFSSLGHVWVFNPLSRDRSGHPTMGGGEMERETEGEMLPEEQNTGQNLYFQTTVTLTLEKLRQASPLRLRAWGLGLLRSHKETAGSRVLSQLEHEKEHLGFSFAQEAQCP